MRKLTWLVLLLVGLSAQVGGAETGSAAQSLPKPRVVEETAPVTLRDDRRATVTLRVPHALHRPANAFRLYGGRPLTLHSRNRRRDLYRDAFLELATRSRLTPAASLWDPLAKQWEWLLRSNPNIIRADAEGIRSAFPEEAEKLAPHLRALTRALREGAAIENLAGPIVEALRLRALATDQAEQRLLRIGQALDREGAPDREGAISDPALRAGFQAARAEFEQLRKGLWPAIATSLKKNGGHLLLRAARDLVLSQLGTWAIFGYLGWQTLEANFNAEYHGQYAVCLATASASLAQRTHKASEALPAALYAEYLLNYELTEALKQGQVMGLKPAGGRAAGSWQVQFTGRCDELRKALTPPVESAQR
jgi:hypothetical protein